jgi:hypothetical protein
MYLAVDAYGNGSGRGTHLSVYLSWMRGEFDDQLRWPFQAKFYVKLVNQEEDRDHVIKTIYSNQCCERVMTKERINNGWGFHEFLPHAKLQPKYLKNDCIKLCVKKMEFY